MYNKGMSLDRTLAQEISVHPYATQYPDSYGIEVELEGRGIRKPPIAVQELWGTHEDGSLRKLLPGSESVEYVSRAPYDPKTTQKSVELLFDYLNSPGVEVFESYRTSIHVHVNFAAEPARVIYNFMTLSLILDELLVSQNGDHRIGNNFCLRAKDAMGQTVSLVKSIERAGNFYNISANERYSSINFASLLKFGSVEFRSLECTTHEGRLMHWINTLGRIKEVSKKFANPTEIIHKFSSLDPHTFLSYVLGPYALKYIKVPDVAQMLYSGMRIAQDLAYCSAWKEAPEASKPTSRRRGAAIKPDAFWVAEA